MNILIVDDHEDSRTMLKKILEFNGYAVQVVSDGKEALKNAKTSPPDMIISDILMPVMDGFQLCREVMADDILKDLLFVFYTATYTHEKDEALALKLGADKFIRKPIDPGDFIKIIKQVFNAAQDSEKRLKKYAPEEEKRSYKLYSERLVRKLENMAVEFQASNQALVREIAERKEAEEELSKRESFLNEVGSIAMIGGWEMDLVTRKAKWTKGTYDIIEIGLGDPIPGPDEHVTYYLPEYRPLVEESMRRLIEEDIPLDFTAQLKTAKGKIKWVRALGKAIREGGNCVLVHGTFQDISEQQRAEEALKSEAIRRHILIEQSRDGIVVLDENGKVYEANQRYGEMLGYSKEEVRQLHLWDWDTQWTREELMERHRNVDEAGDFFETRHRRKDGTYFDVEISTNGAVIEGRKMVFCVCRDITERKQAEEKIKEYSMNLEQMVQHRTEELHRSLYDTEEARDRIDGILKSVGDGLLVTDQYNRVILMNRAAEDLLGVRFSTVIDRSIDFAIQDETLRDRIKNTLSETQDGHPFDFELPGEDAKHSRIIRARTSVIEDRHGKQTGTVTIFHDVTHEREVDRMKSEFISLAAHKLRTPLTSIVGFSEILLTRDRIKEEEKKNFLSHINKQSVNLAAIINDLLDISRIESGLGFSLKKTPSGIGDMIEDLVALFRERYPAHRFELVLPEEPVELMVDIEKMGQALENILSNAGKYSPGGGLIRVAGELLEDRYQVSIQDHGIGMTPEQVEKIFDKFYRTDASNTAIEGAGLGMNIVKYLIEAHDGKIWVDSQFGKGTTVTFTIPVSA